MITVVVCSMSRPLYSFIRKELTKTGYASIWSVLPADMMRRTDRISPDLVLYDFSAGYPVSTVAHAFPKSKIAVVAGVAGCHTLEKQLDASPYFHFIEKPCSSESIREVLRFVAT